MLFSSVAQVKLAPVQTNPELFVHVLTGVTQKHFSCYLLSKYSDNPDGKCTALSSCLHVSQDDSRDCVKFLGTAAVPEVSSSCPLVSRGHSVTLPDWTVEGALRQRLTYFFRDSPGPPNVLSLAMGWLHIWWSVNQPWRTSSGNSGCCFQYCPEPDDPFVNL